MGEKATERESVDIDPVEDPAKPGNVVALRPRIVSGCPDVSFTAPANYAQYVSRTNEKGALQERLIRAFDTGQLPIRPGEHGKRVLDLGSGLGSHTRVLSALFEHHDVHALDVSRQFLRVAESNLVHGRIHQNVTFFNQAFEDFERCRYDFILCSHVLQYIDTALESFVHKIIDSLKADGEAWIVLQEDRGLNQLITAARPYIVRPSPYFTDWFTHKRVRDLLCEDFRVRMTYERFESHFEAPCFDSLTATDEQLLQFILLDGFDPANAEMIRALRDTTSSISPSGILAHDVGITRIRRGA